MRVETLEEIACAAKDAAKARRKLEKLNASYVKKTSDGFSRALTTSYNASCADIMENQVKPNEDFLKTVLGGK